MVSAALAALHSLVKTGWTGSLQTTGWAQGASPCQHSIIMIFISSPLLFMLFYWVISQNAYSILNTKYMNKDRDVLSHTGRQTGVSHYPPVRTAANTSLSRQLNLYSIKDFFTFRVKRKEIHKKNYPKLGISYTPLVIFNPIGNLNFSLALLSSLRHTQSLIGYMYIPNCGFDNMKCIYISICRFDILYWG